MWKKLTVSIIVPCYHAEKFIQQCIDTLINQTYTNWEAIFVVEDHEYDNTLNIIRDGGDPRLNIIYRLNKSSPAAARNIGFSVCKGEYICFLDVDDYWEPQKLEKQIALMEEGNYDISFTSGYWHLPFGTFIIDVSDLNGLLFIWSSVMFKGSSLTRAECCRGYLFNEYQPQCDDGELLIYMHKHGYTTGLVHENLSHIVEHGGNLTQGQVWGSCYWAAKGWFRHGYMINGIKYIAFGIIGVVSDVIGIRPKLREYRIRRYHSAEEVK